MVTKGRCSRPFLQVDLPIQFDQHKTVLVSFTGRGYDPSQLEPPDVADTSLAVATSNSHDITISVSGSSLLTVNQVSVSVCGYC